MGLSTTSTDRKLPPAPSKRDDPPCLERDLLREMAAYQKALRSDVSDPSSISQIRTELSKLLLQVTRDGELVELSTVQACLNFNDQIVNSNASYALGELGSQGKRSEQEVNEIIELLSTLAETADFTYQGEFALAAALEALGKIQTPNALETLVRLCTGCTKTSIVVLYGLSALAAHGEMCQPFLTTVQNALIDKGPGWHSRDYVAAVNTVRCSLRAKRAQTYAGVDLPGEFDITALQSSRARGEHADLSGIERKALRNESSHSQGDPLYFRMGHEKGAIEVHIRFNNSGEQPNKPQVFLVQNCTGYGPRIDPIVEYLALVVAEQYGLDAAQTEWIVVASADSGHSIEGGDEYRRYWLGLDSADSSYLRLIGVDRLRLG